MTLSVSLCRLACPSVGARGIRAAGPGALLIGLRISSITSLLARILLEHLHKIVEEIPLYKSHILFNLGYG